MNNDLISREAVKKKIDKFIGYLDEDMIYRIKVAIDKVPTVKCASGDEYIACHMQKCQEEKKQKGGAE